MIHCNIVTFSIVIPFQINCKTHCNSFSCDDVLLKYHYYYIIIRRKRIKKFFLSGIHESVKENQIWSYLEQRNITPTHISLFRSQRRGTRSAKVHIPSSAGLLVQSDSFWPKFVKCRPWQPINSRNSTKREIKINTTHNGKYSTYV